jgi:SAM-dependent methyltransferase
MIGNKIEEFVGEGDRVAIAGITESNAAVIADMAGKFGVEVVGGYQKDGHPHKIDTMRNLLPVFCSFSELLEKLETNKQPNKIAICLPPAHIYEEIERITKCGSTSIDTLLIIPRISSIVEIEKINRICRQANLNLFFNFTPFDWEHIYGNNELKNIGWYLAGLDPDLEESLKKRNIGKGTFLDIGTGPGTQAIELAAWGFTVTATDISDAVIKKVRKLSAEVDFLVDDIINSSLDKKFDYISDRGCFHSVNPADRSAFVKQVCRLLKKDGIFFLKCFSDKEGWFSGPYRFSSENIETIFGEYFKILGIKVTRFYGQSAEPLASLFAVMQHK